MFLIKIPLQDINEKHLICGINHKTSHIGEMKIVLIPEA